METSDAIAQDVSSGVLAEGAKLPTHRELAGRLGVTVGTVTRGYAEAERRGLTVAEVGRGTYVRSRREAEDFG
jgi:DNA-binding transcriptional regulator YhcF (GntR family)